MRKIPHSVMVIHSANELGENRSLLVSSFNTVTLSPTPLVSFNIKLPSRTHSAITSSGIFTASALWNPRAARNFSGHYVKKHPWVPKIPVEGEYTTYLATNRVWGMRCRLLQDKCVEVGDHMIMVGEVLEYEPPIGDLENKQALLYQDGTYRKPGANVDLAMKREEEEKVRAGELNRVLGRVGQSKLKTEFVRRPNGLGI